MRISTQTWAKLTMTWFLLLLMTPVVMLLAGSRATTSKESPLPNAPNVHALSVLEADFYQRLGTFVDFRLPSRDLAIRANAQFALRYFHESAFDKVSAGNDGWLFLRSEISDACEKSISNESIVMVIDAVTRTKKHEIFVVVPPPKAIVESAHLTDPSLRTSCLKDDVADFWQELSKLRNPNIVDAWTPILNSASRNGAAFWKTDSHLNVPARLALVRSLIDRIQPGVWDDSDLKNLGPSQYATDLKRMAGIGGRENFADQRVQRVGAVTTPVVSRVDYPAPSAVFATTGVRVVPGRTLVICDSQFELAAADLIPWFQEVQFVHWQDLYDVQWTDSIQQADRIVLETVHRDMQYRFDGRLAGLLVKP